MNEPAAEDQPKAAQGRTQAVAGRTKSMAGRMDGADAGVYTSKSYAGAFTNRTSPPIVQRYAALTHDLPSARRQRDHTVAPRPKSVTTIRRAMRATEAAPRSRAGRDKLVESRASVAGRFWQPFFSARTSETGDLSTHQSRAMSSAAQRDVAWPQSLIGNLAPIEPRLTRSVSSSPRHEVPGGFPTVKPSLQAMQETARKTQDMTRPPLWQHAEASLAQPTSLAQHTKTHEVSRSQPYRREVAVQDSSGEPGEAIERLIQHTLLPAPLPGLELRLLAPDNQRPSIGRSSNADSGEQPAIASQLEPGSQHQIGGQNETGGQNEKGSSPSPRTAPAQPQAPEINIAEVADKVYQTLMRRQQLERERKGLY